MKIVTATITMALICSGAFAQVLFENVPFYQGMNSYHTYRIPALYETQSGVLLAFAEGRKNGTSDTGDIDTVLRRSFDGGNSWQPMQIVWTDGGNTCGNPTVVQDSSTGRIWLFMTHNLGQDSQSEISGGTSDGVRTIWSCYSDNDGATWSVPVNRFNEVQPSTTRWDATGPGRGLQLQQGFRAGRLVIPANGRNIHSDDNGATWQQSTWLPSGSSESQAVEVQGGTILRNDRVVANKDLNARVFSKSCNQGSSWTSLQFRQDLKCPICQASTIAVPDSSSIFGRMLVFSNPSSVHRENMTVQYSYNDGASWDVKRMIYPGAAAYSCLSPIGENQFGLLYENGDSYSSALQLYRRITFAKFSKDWVTDKAVATWDFEQYQLGKSVGTTAGEVKDKRGYGLDATADISYTVVVGALGRSKAVRFTGGGKGIRISDSDAKKRINFGNDDSFTLRAVFRTTSHCDGGVSGAGALIAKDVGPSTKSWWLRVQDGRVRFFINDGPASASVWGPSIVCDGRWYEVLAVRDAADKMVRLYINGKLEGENVDNTTEGFANTNSVSIGCYNTGSSSFIGDIGLAQIYSTTEKEIMTVFDGDLDFNRIVDIEDLYIIGGSWLYDQSPKIEDGDINDDGMIDMFDFSVIAQNWLKSGY